MIPDPLTTATTFATLVSLISDFRDKHKEQAVDLHEKFLGWLAENRHDEIKALLEQSQETVISIKAILNQDYAVITEKLQNIDSKLATLLSEDKLFSKLVEAIHPQYLLSEQALNILIQFENLQASKLLQIVHSRGSTYIFMDGHGGNLEFHEPRFIRDDIERLIDLGLLRSDVNSQGKPLYLYTRVASSFVNKLSNLSH